MFFCQGTTSGANDSDKRIKTFAVKKDGQGEDAVLWTKGEASDTIEERREKGLSEHANNGPTAMADDGDIIVSLSAGKNNNVNNANGGVE